MSCFGISSLLYLLSHGVICFLGCAIEQAGKCNLFNGDWIPDPSGPVYTNETCKFIESHQNCMTNGRPDTGYLYWRWNPRSCQLPRFDSHKFLQLMSNKTWALIGDSISRNHVQSFLCVLSKVTSHSRCQLFYVASVSFGCSFAMFPP